MNPGAVRMYLGSSALSVASILVSCPGGPPRMGLRPTWAVQGGVWMHVPPHDPHRGWMAAEAALSGLQHGPGRHRPGSAVEKDARWTGWDGGASQLGRVAMLQRGVADRMPWLSLSQAHGYLRGRARIPVAFGGLPRRRQWWGHYVGKGKGQGALSLANCVTVPEPGPGIGRMARFHCSIPLPAIAARETCYRGGREGEREGGRQHPTRRHTHSISYLAHQPVKTSCSLPTKLFCKPTSWSRTNPPSPPLHISFLVFFPP